MNPKQDKTKEIHIKIHQVILLKAKHTKKIFLQAVKEMTPNFYKQMTGILPNSQPKSLLKDELNLAKLI